MTDLFDLFDDDADPPQDTPPPKSAKRGSFSPAELLDLPEHLSDLVQQMLKKNGLTIPQVAEILDDTPASARKILDDLIDQGYVRRRKTSEGPIYKAKLGQTQGRRPNADLWSALDDL